MAVTCPVDLDTLRLRTEIESIYRRVATEPSGDSLSSWPDVRHGDAWL